MKYIICFFSVILVLSADAQNSYSKIFNTPAGFFWPITAGTKVFFGNNNELSFANRYSLSPEETMLNSEILLTELDGFGNVETATILATPVDLDDTKWESVQDYNRKGAFHAIQVSSSFANSYEENKQGLFLVNLTQDVKWAKRSAQGITSERVHLLDDFVFSSRKYAPDSMTERTQLGLSLFHLLDGSPEWEYHYTIDSAVISSLDYSVLELNSYNENVLSCIGNFREGNDDFSYYFNKHDGSGNVEESLIFDTEIVLLSHNYKSNGHVVLSGRIYLGSPLSYDGFIAELDENLEIIWAKRLSADYFSCFDIKLKLFPNGDILFIYVARGDFPVIVGKINASGNLLYNQGFAFFSPQVDINTDNSIAFLSGKVYLENGGVDFRPQIIKTDENGVIEQCRQYNSCIEVENYQLTANRLSWIRDTAPALPDLELLLEPHIINNEGFCGTPPPSKPYFSLPDTICQNNCLEADSLQNALAHHAEWNILGPNIDTLVEGKTFEWCFMEPGIYRIEQTIWLLGCSEKFSKSLEVLPNDLAPFLKQDTFACNDQLVISPTASRPLQQFLWSTGESNESILVNQEGEYSLEVSDGYCIASDTISVTFFKNEFPLPVFRDFLEDTSLCQVSLPFIYEPQSNYADSFYLSDSDIPTTSLSLPLGRHTIRAIVAGCEFPEEIEVFLINCDPTVYLPNVFSPNNDGQNDFFEALGQNFMPLELSVFNRWGGLVYTTNKSPFRWDGTRQQTRESSGVYLVTFRFLNTLNQKEEVLYGDILLLR